MGIGRVFFPQPVAGHPHQSVGHRQLVLPGQADVLRFGAGQDFEASRGGAVPTLIVAPPTALKLDTAMGDSASFTG